MWCRGGRASESGDAGKSRGPRRERSSPGHRDAGWGSRRGEAAMATGARVAAAIACAGRSMGGVWRVLSWRGLRVLEEVRYADAWLGRETPAGVKGSCLSAGESQQRATRQTNHAGLTVRFVVFVQCALSAIIDSHAAAAVLLTRIALLAVHFST